MRKISAVHIPSALIGAGLLAVAQLKSPSPTHSSGDAVVQLQPRDDFEQRAAEIIQIVRADNSPCRRTHVALTGNAHVPFFVNNQRGVSPMYDEKLSTRPEAMPVPHSDFTITPAMNGAIRSIHVTITGDRSDISACQRHVIDAVNTLRKKPSTT